MKRSGGETSPGPSLPTKHALGTELSTEPGQLGGKNEKRASGGWLRPLPEDTDRLSAHVCVQVRECSVSDRDYKFQSAQRRAARGL